jgi:hypothetical protein
VHSEALEQYALLDDNDVLCAIKAWIASEDKVLSKLSASFINRQLFRGELIEAPLTEAQKEALNKEYAKALEWYEKYLKVARPGSKGYEFAADNVAYIKSELFMETP